MLRETHALLSQHFDQLLSFDAMLIEANQSFNMSSSHSRIIFHVIFELSKDFFPNFNYNSITQRFIRSVILFAEQAERDSTKSSITMLYGSKVRHLSLSLSLFLSLFLSLAHARSLKGRN